MAKKKSDTAASKKSDVKSTTKDISKIIASSGEAILGNYTPPDAQVASNVNKTKDRPIVELDDELKEDFVQFVMLKTIEDRMGESKKEITDDVYSRIFEKYTQSLWKAKVQPKNPSVVVKNDSGQTEASGMFIVMVGSKIKINMPSLDGKSPIEALVSGLISYGVDEENAANIVQEQVFFVPEFSLNFTEMINGRIVSGKLESSSDIEKTSATILFKSIFDNFEDKEQRLDFLSNITEEGWMSLKESVNSRIKYEPRLRDGANFFDNICKYASSYEELCGILKVFRPVYYCKSCQFAPKDSNRVFRLIEKAAEVLSEKEKAKEEKVSSS